MKKRKRKTNLSSKTFKKIRKKCEVLGRKRRGKKEKR